MNLHDFEDHIDDIILARGSDYYDNGRISSVQKTGENTYRAEVAGTDDYIVTVKLDDDDGILSSDCNCLASEI